MQVAQIYQLAHIAKWVLSLPAQDRPRVKYVNPTNIPLQMAQQLVSRVQWESTIIAQTYQHKTKPAVNYASQAHSGQIIHSGQITRA